MTRSRIPRALPVLAVGLLLLVLTGGSALADPITKPNGPWVTDTQNVSIQGIHSYDQIMKDLKQIEQSSQGAVQVIEPPYRAKATNRILPAVKIGTGPGSMMIITQQHGDEYVTTEGALNLIQYLGGNSREAKAIRDAITLIVMPRVNVDGFDATPTGNPWRYDIDPLASGPFSSPNRGYDINRYHPMGVTENPYDTSQANPVPEALAVRALFEQYKPEILMDMHHQGTYVDAEGDMIKTSTLWPTAVGVEEDVVTMAKQVVGTVVTRLQQYGYANITRYPGDEYPGIARNRYGLLGAATVLVELRGTQEAKSNGYIAKTAYQAMMSVVESYAAGTLDETSTDIADTLPARGPGVSRDLPGNEGEAAEGA